MKSIFLLVNEASITGAYETLEEAKDNSKNWDTIFEVVRKIENVPQTRYVSRPLATELNSY